MKLTIITNGDGLLTKRITHDGGKLHKETFANIQHGTAKRIECNSFGELRTVFEGLRHDQAIVHCPHNHEYDLVPLTTKAKVGNGKIARSNEFFDYAQGESVPMSFDYDGDERITRDQWLENAKRVCAAFENVGVVVMPSSSGSIYKDGELVGDSTGMRIIVGVQDASDIPRASKALAARCWLAGLGNIFISADGKMHERTIFDLTMHQPTRIDFLAGAELGEGVEQKRDVWHREGPLLDTRAILDLTGDEQRRVHDLQHEARKKVEAKARRVREQWEHRRMETLRERGVPVTRAAEMIKAQLAGVLTADDVLEFDTLGGVRILDCLKQPEKFAGKSCADPLEPERGGSRAGFRYNEATQIATVWSYLHGGQLYKIEFNLETLLDFYAALPDDDPRVRRIDKLIRQAKLEPVEIEEFLEAVRRRTNIAIATLRQQAKRAFFSDDDLTHQQMAERYIREKGEFVFTDGGFWMPSTQNVWEKFPTAVVQTEIGQKFEEQRRCKTGSAYKQIRQTIENNVEDEKFFKDAPRGFACPSGFYYLDGDGKLVHEPLKLSHRARFVLPFDPVDEPPTMFLDLLADWFESASPETQIDRVQEIVGAIMLGIGVDFEKAIFAFGPGNSGKSTFMRIVERLIPEEFVCSVPAALFANPTYKARVAGKLLCTMGEGSDLSLGDDFKSMTGRDRQTARPLYENPFDFYPSATILVNANEPPIMQKLDDAMKRRLETLTFPNSRVVSGKARDNITDLDQRVIAEDRGRLIHWALIGGQRAKAQGGYSFCPSNMSTLEQWELQNDNAQQFLMNETLVKITGKADDWTRRSSLYRMYEDWSSSEGLKPMTKAKFSHRMTELGYPTSVLDGYEIVRKILPRNTGDAVSSLDDKEVY